jgi:hypothetical protein
VAQMADKYGLTGGAQHRDMPDLGLTCSKIAQLMETVSKPAQRYDTPMTLPTSNFPITGNVSEYVPVTELRAEF